MSQFKIGVMLESFKDTIDNSLEKAVKVGAQGIQVYSTYGELSPDKLSKDQRKEFIKKVTDKGLVVSAVCGDLGKGFSDKELNADLVEKSKRILDLALEWNTNIVTTHVGVVPEDKNHERYKVMQEACFILSQYADSLKSHFAIETGPETAVVLKGFLDSLNSKGVAVNLDPANFVMVTGDDPVQAVYTLKDYIVHTHAKDGLKLLDQEPEIIYGVRDIEEVIQEGEAFREVPLGEGDVDFKNYLKALKDIGFNGFLTIEREVGDNPYDDIDKAVKFLYDIIKYM